MLTKNYRKIICVVTVGLYSSISSCKKLVEIDRPENTVTQEVAYSSNALATQAVVGLYSKLMSGDGTPNFANGTTSLYAALSADELLGYTGTGSPIDYQFSSGNIQSDNSIPEEQIWKIAYQLIYNCNAAVEQLSGPATPALDAATRKQLTGEAKFLRAFSYFYLVNFFGDVPLVLTTDFNQTKLLARSPQEQVYEQMVRDLSEAAQSLPDNYTFVSSKSDRVRANKWAATALLARVYLYRKDFGNALKESSSVIGNTQLFTLSADLSKVFDANNREAILQWQQNKETPPIYNATWDGKNFLPVFSWKEIVGDNPADEALYLSDVNLYESISTLCLPNYYFTPELLSAFENGDARLKAWATYLPSPTIAPYTGASFYYPRKYRLSIFSPTDEPPQYYMVLRLAEQYLIRAEAKAQLGDLNGALADLNIIRSRARAQATNAVPDPLPSLSAGLSQTNVLAAVAHERQTELFAEWGHRFFDLKRTGKANDVLGALKGKQPWNASKLLYPIPAREISTNPNIVQNPGYSF
ncbi:RagB/SusD family nutrient uptake outer membrane protein [Mucilaginibacter conchicola]|uniref:RagB/SusD family nutrient uptake outer membrane protein n=1 Tax=Mucilaginibacter conchicola TaxID=2303333 RepID=A0A372NMP9_9SPHI|nr:RagB/SusD family nutrient uptake outer membrane protein [Mucilaginibacter conchicola]RFZ90232.1 RagB/SusD family nutrient uptake outer membrane protein [Mucilaginibacter conchicola]